MALVVSKFKTETDLNKALLKLGDGIKATVEALSAGNVSATKSLITSPESLLEGHQQAMISVLDSASGTSFRFNITPIVGIFLGPLFIHHGEATGIVSRQPALLAYLHAWCWDCLRVVVERVDGVPSWPLAPIVRHFLTKYHCSWREPGGKTVYGALFGFLKSLPGGYHSFLIAGITRNLIDFVLEVLGGTPSSPNATGIAATAQKTIKGRRKDARQGEESSTSSTSDADLQGRILQWIDVAFGTCDFQSCLLEASRSALVQCLFKLYLKGGSLAPISLSALGSAILGEQPARLSPYLPILVRIISVALHSDDPAVQQEAKNIARQVDLLIRPRRPYAPKGKGAMQGQDGHIEQSPPRERNVAFSPTPFILNTPPVVAPLSSSSLDAEKPNPPDDASSLTTPPFDSSINPSLHSDSVQAESVVEVLIPAIPLSAIPTKRPFEASEMEIKLDTLNTEGDGTPLPTLIDEGPDEE